MSNAENKRLHLDSLFAVSSEKVQDSLSVLYAAPLLTDNQHINYIQNKYAQMIVADDTGSNNILSYCSLEKKESSFLKMSELVQEIYTFGRFLYQMRLKIKPYTTLHLFMFTSVSFLFQIIPLIILGKFYRKNVVIEFFNFHNYYLPEEGGTVVRYFLKIADAVIVPSDRQSRTLKQKRIKAVTFHEQIQIESITPRVIEGVQPKILVSAYFEDVFNINSLLKAFMLVKQKYPRAELFVAGVGSQQDSMKNIVLSKSLSGVYFKSKEETEQLYNEADIFVHSYHIEYFAHEILRAMAYGLPVIASPIGMVNKLIQKENILMYQFNDFSTLADHILLLVENNAITRQLSVNGAKFVRGYAAQNNSEDTVTFYRNFS